MEVEHEVHASGPIEQEVGESAPATKTVLIDLDHADFATPSNPNPFAVKSVVKSTEMAFKIAAESIGGSLQVVASEEKEEPDDVTLQHDEVDLNPIEDIDVLKNIMEDQDTDCVDEALGKCLSSSMITEAFVENFLCKADRTLFICQTTDWMEKASGYMCGCDEKAAEVSDDDTKSTYGSTIGSQSDSFLANDECMSIESASQPNHLLNSILESHKSFIGTEVEIGEQPQDEHDDIKFDDQEKVEDESGFECVLERKLALEEEKGDESVTTSSPAKLTEATKDNARNQQVVTPSTEKSMKHSKSFRLGKLSRKMTFKRITIAEF